MSQQLTTTSDDRASVWISWYFKRGAWTALTAPLFVVLAISVVISCLGAVQQYIAFGRAARAVFGGFLGFLAMGIGWLPLILPPALYYSLIRNLPGVWLRQDAPLRNKLLTTLAVFVLLPLAAYLIFHGTAWCIGWIADRDPCAAEAAGVIGSKLCERGHLN